VDIDEKRANANKVLAAAIDKLMDLNILLISADGGKAHNAIPRYSQAFLAYPADNLEEMGLIIAQLQSELLLEYADREPGLTLRIEQEKFDAEIRAIFPALQRSLSGCAFFAHLVLFLCQDLQALLRQRNLATIKSSRIVSPLLSARDVPIMASLGAYYRINSLARSQEQEYITVKLYFVETVHVLPLLQKCKRSMSLSLVKSRKGSHTCGLAVLLSVPSSRVGYDIIRTYHKEPAHTLSGCSFLISRTGNSW
jgi:hypothetical protein